LARSEEVLVRPVLAEELADLVDVGSGGSFGARDGPVKALVMSIGDGEGRRRVERSSEARMLEVLVEDCNADGLGFC